MNSASFISVFENLAKFRNLFYVMPGHMILSGNFPLFCQVSVFFFKYPFSILVSYCLFCMAKFLILRFFFVFGIRISRLYFFAMIF